MILKLPLVVRFDKDLAEIWGVKEKASISKSSRFICVRVYKTLSKFTCVEKEIPLIKQLMFSYTCLNLEDK